MIEPWKELDLLTQVMKIKEGLNVLEHSLKIVINEDAAQPTQN